jgi:hypothetical protein
VVKRRQSRKRGAAAPWQRLLLALGLAMAGCNAFDAGLLAPRDEGEMDGGAIPGPGGDDAGDGDGDGDGDAATDDDGGGPGGDRCGCELPNATVDCDDDAGCEIAACLPGYLDCDGEAASGCEVDAQRDPQHCGGCDMDCGALLDHTAETACGSGQVCEVVSCAEGWASCDGEDATGCETSIYTLDDCGGCSARGENEDCSNLPNAAASACPVGNCEIDACEDGWANCDGDANNGCEHDESALGPCMPRLMRISTDPSFIDAPLSDFPVLVRITDPELTTARSDGTDLVFSSDGGGADSPGRLPFEIERWDPDAGALVAWVRLSSVSATTPTIFYLRYGDGLDLSAGISPQNVWDANHESVHHFAGGVQDSTTNGIDGVDVGTTADPDGAIGPARAFAGAQYIDMGTGVLPDETSFTVSAWVKADLSTGEAQMYVMDASATGAPYPGVALGLQRSDGAVGAYVNTQWRFSSTDAVESDTWSLIAVRYQIAATGGVFESSVNGEPFETVFTGDTSDAQNTAMSPFQVGRWAGGMFHFVGSIDELRVSSTQRSDAWMRAVYENQRSGSTFLTVVVE